MTVSKGTRVALYARVSTDGQTVNNQLQELREVAERHGWKVLQEFTDKGISGAKGREQRPAFDALCKGAARREFDMVAAWSVDRLGRSLQHLVAFLPCSCQPCPYSFLDHCSFELSEHAQHTEHCFSTGSGRVYSLLVEI